VNWATAQQAEREHGMKRPLEGIRIIIVDDNAVHSQGIKQLLELQTDAQVIGIAHSVHQLQKQLVNLEPDMILMDMNLPEIDGIAAIQQVTAQHPAIKMMALTGYDDKDFVFRAMRAGARGYLLKTMITTQLVQALEDIGQGKIYLPTAIATKFFEEFHGKVNDMTKKEITKKALLAYLTTREREVLTLLTEGITYKGVADKLVISETTVKTHVNNIFQKLQVNDRTQAVLFALKYNLVDNSDKMPSIAV
jgi:two-component system, NarL family, response regulator DegU